MSAFSGHYNYRKEKEWESCIFTDVEKKHKKDLVSHE